jgi:hypothetical protein
MTPEQAYSQCGKPAVVFILDTTKELAHEIAVHLCDAADDFLDFGPVTVAVALKRARVYIAVDEPPEGVMRIVSIGDTVSIEDRPFVDTRHTDTHSRPWHREPVKV